MTWHCLGRVRIGALACTALLAAACGSSSKNASIEITAPEKGAELTLANDDLDSTKDGLQYNVTATSSGLGAGTGVLLTIEGESDAAVANVGKDGSIMFSAVTLPPGKHTIKVATNNGDVHSPDDWDYTLKALTIKSPRDGAALGLADDKDTMTDGIQVNVTVLADPVDLTDAVSLQVDNKTVGDSKHPDADGMIVFSGVTLANGDHVLKAVAGSAESSQVHVSVNPNCASVSFVTPEPPSNGDALVLGGGDKCPEAGKDFVTDITIATDAGENRDVDLVVNETTVATTKVKSAMAKFSNVVLDRRDTPNTVSVIVQGAQGVTCKPVAYPVDIKVDCDGVDCSISSPKPVAGLDAGGNRVFYLNKAQRGDNGFEFQVHTFSSAIGKPVKLIVDGNDLDAPTANPSGTDPNVAAKFTDVDISDGSHTIQARCEDNSGNVNFSNKASWTIDTQACGVDITRPSANTILVPALDKDTNKMGVQIEVEAKLSGDDCTATRAAPCVPKDGIKDATFSDFDGGSTLTSTVTLTNDADQTLCVEVEDRAGNIGSDNVAVKYRAQAPMVQIETPSDGDKFNADGTTGYKQDSDTGSADVCNANFDVACTELGTDVKLHRGDANGTVFATASCAKKANGAANLPAGFSGRAHFANAVFLPNDADNVTVVATQTLSSGGNDLVGKSNDIKLKGDCQKPNLSFVQDPCEGGQIPVANANATSTKDVVAADSTTDTTMAHVSVTSGGSEVTAKDATASNGTYTFSGVALGGPGSGRRDITITVSAKDDYDNTGSVKCDAGIVFDLPSLTVSEPADNAVLAIGSGTGRCTATGGGDGATLTATADMATNRTASVSVNGGADIALPLSGTALSACVPIAHGTNMLAINLVSTTTTATATVMRTITFVSEVPMTGIELTTNNSPSDRNGKVSLAFTAPTDNFPGQFVSYQLRCDPVALDVGTLNEGQQAAWWAGARTVTLPSDFKPPSSSVDVDMRVGELSNCVLRAADASGGLTPLVNSKPVEVPFRTSQFAPSSTGQYAGWDFAGVGDVSGDGIDDMLVGGYGESYLVLGSDTALSATPKTIFVSDPGSAFGDQVVGIGKFNGDDFNDIAITQYDWNNGVGRVFVFFGRANDDWPGTVNVAGTSGCGADLCFDNAVGSSFGSSIAGIGDFNADGRDDMAIGTFVYPDVNTLSGRLYILLGKDYETGASTSNGFYGLSFAVDTSNALQGYVVQGDTNSGLGKSIAALGTFDSTPGTDLAVSAFGNAGVQGRVYFMSGRTGMPAGLTSLTTAQFGFRNGGGNPDGAFIDTGASGNFGYTVTAVGNAYNVGATTGKPDLAIYSYSNGFDIYPGDNNFAPADKITLGSIATAGYFGENVCTGRVYGDLDGDGLAEVCASGEADPTTGTGQGIGSLWYGDVIARKLAAKTVNTSAASPIDPPVGAGVTFRPIEFVGDLNKDGKLDLAIGGPGANSNTGEYTILY